MTRVLIAGVATRGLAESAVRAGYEVVAVDGFGDLDLQACARTVVVARSGGRFSVRAAVRAAHEHHCDAVCYVASFENHPWAVAALARLAPLWGNRAGVLRRTRDPVRLARTLAARGFATPATRSTRPRAPSACEWLVKPRASGGGRGVAVWRFGQPVAHGRYLQQRIRGASGSIVFAADGRRAVPLGLSLQLVGERAFGASGFGYCGSILSTRPSPLRPIARRLATAVTEAFGLVGVNGVDFIAVGDVPYPIEVNPRYTASMELVERACGVSLFATHVRACAGSLPPRDLAAQGGAPGAVGKAILYARHDTTAPDTRAWLDDDTVRDVPAPGTPIARGQPICTIFATGATVARCHAALVARAQVLYHTLDARQAKTA